MIDVKKFVTGFLIIAVGVGTAALLVSGIGNKSIATADTLAQATDTSALAAALPGNAFLAQNPQTGAVVVVTDDQLASTTAASMNDPNNLTNLLASAYLNNLMTTNPSGPLTDANGSPVLTPPDDTNVLNQFASSSVAAVASNFITPDWTVEINQIPINLSGDTSPDAIKNYNGAIQDIFNKNFVQPGLQNMLSQNTDPSAAAFAQAKITTALQNIAGLQTPTSLKNFQKSLITMLVYEKNIAALTAGISASPDPLKTALILQNETPKYNDALLNFQVELNNATAMNNGVSPLAMVTPPKAGGVIGLLNAALGIKQAYAIFGLGDITFDPSNFAQMLINYANNVILQIAKNLITSIMQKTVLKWVQGNGVPKFVQDWGSTLVQSYMQTALGAIDSQMQCVSSAPYAAQLRLVLGATYKPDNQNVCAVQFQGQLANNLTQFYGNFSNGGWLTYGATMQPSNNYYGSLFFMAQVVGNTAQGGQVATQAQNTANQGWTGKQTCADGSDPNGKRLSCRYVGSDGSVGYYNLYEGSCGPGEQTVTEWNHDTCTDGTKPITTQPGQVTGQVFNSGIDSSGKLTTAANDIAGLLDAFLNSLLNSLASDAITTAGGALQNLGSGGGSGGGGTGGSGGGSAGGGQAGQVPISCTATAQNQANPNSITFMGAGGQSISANGGQVSTSQPSYSWSVPGGTPAVGTGGNFTTTLNASGTYTATMTDTNPADGGVTARCSVTIP